MKNIPRPPKSIAHYKVPHFLAFHQSKVKACHYFRYDDSPRFFTKGILEMTKQSPPLEYAVASFAALVYSVLIDKKAKVFAFIFYAEALRGLQEILNRLLVGKDDDYSDALAVVLQLASIEVYVLRFLVGLTIAFRCRYRKVLPPPGGRGKDSAYVFNSSFAMFQQSRSFFA